MADVQQQFREFHEAIKLDDENETLREKREIIVSKLKEKLGDDYPSFKDIVQGSYAMSTGIKPLNGEYDIDVGIWFDVDKDDYEDPVELKEWIADALKSHTKTPPQIKDPCVKITYQQGGEPAFHVDLPVYAAKNKDGKLYLARGKKYSLPENRRWEASDPRGLIDLVKYHFDDQQDRNQFRRVIRALKRWAEVQFEGEGHGKPTGVALTVCALNWMQPSYIEDSFSHLRRYQDLDAVLNLVTSMLNNFQYTWHDGELAQRLIVYAPVEPYDDLFKKMTNNQMENFRTKLLALQEALETAKEDADPTSACETLREQFGDDFPVPPKDQTGQRRGKAITTHSESAR